MRHINMMILDFGMPVASFWQNTFLGIEKRAKDTELENVVLFLKQPLEGFQKNNLRSIVEFSEFMERGKNTVYQYNSSITL